jgi:hypothetical protein
MPTIMLQANDLILQQTQITLNNYFVTNTITNVTFYNNMITIILALEKCHVMFVS